MVPDVVWISRGGASSAWQTGGSPTRSPELAIEILSAGAANERRDREVKLGLYSRQGVLEYWIVNWFGREVLVYRRAKTGLDLVAALHDGDDLDLTAFTGFHVSSLATLELRAITR